MHTISRRQFVVVASVALTGCLDRFNAMPLIRDVGGESYYLVDELGNHLTDENGNRLVGRLGDRLLP